MLRLRLPEELFLIKHLTEVMPHQPRRTQTARMSSGGRKPKARTAQPAPPAQIPSADASDPDSSPNHNTASSIPPINPTRQSTFRTDFLAARARVKELVPLAKKKNPALTELIVERFNAEREALERLPMETTSDAHVDEHNARWHYAILQQTISKLISVVDIIWENRFEDYYTIFGDRFCVEEMTSHCHDLEMISIINAVPDVFGDLLSDKYL